MTRIVLWEREEDSSWTSAQAAGALGISIRHVYRLVERHGLPVIHIGDAVRPRLRFDPEAVASWWRRMVETTGATTYAAARR